MSKAPKPLTIDLKRVVAAAPAKVYDAWMDPKQPCNPWSYGDTLSMDPKVGKPFCIVMGGGHGAHFGRFLKLGKGKQIQHTWMSRYTRGMETTVTLDFKKHANGTLVTLRHTGLSDDADGRVHVGGWEQFLETLEVRFTPKGRN